MQVLFWGLTFFLLTRQSGAHRGESRGSNPSPSFFSFQNNCLQPFLNWLLLFFFILRSKNTPIFIMLTHFWSKMAYQWYFKRLN